VQGQLEYDQYGEAVFGGGGKVVLMRANGSGKKELAFCESTDSASWSPDGAGSHMRRTPMPPSSTDALLSTSSIPTAAGCG
jgi:hypothetical protein